ncbi:hypothetical protein AVEN_138927-1 [Araneus ventricosus]|uniref:Uncharacterized protein n=1 Tax=Araneus ventricosus TaxID=182803 RepID=A0A4Y2KB07_ARAVE|nr:hypothetical protein AVEN_138927-1 [Araneus ventricosus]
MRLTFREKAFPDRLINFSERTRRDKGMLATLRASGIISTPPRKARKSVTEMTCPLKIGSAGIAVGLIYCENKRLWDVEDVKHHSSRTLQFNGITVHERSNSSQDGYLPPINVIPNHETTRSARKLMSREFGKLPISRCLLPSPN